MLQRLGLSGSRGSGTGGSNFENFKFDPPDGLLHGIGLDCEKLEQEVPDCDSRCMSEANGITKIKIGPLVDFCPPMQFGPKLRFFASLNGNNAKTGASVRAMLIDC